MVSEWGSEWFLRYLGLSELVEPGHASESAPDSGILNLNYLAKLYINIYHIRKNSEQSLQWLVRNSPDKILAVLGMPVGQP